MSVEELKIIKEMVESVASDFSLACLAFAIAWAFRGLSNK